MLVEFTVKNYRSIKSEQTFSFAKAKGNELISSNCFTPTAPGSVELVRSAVIYGANAAGKSNIVKAMMDMRSIVTDSASAHQEGDDLPIETFLFDDKTQSAPSEFEVVFINDGVRYQYGFTATKKVILDEWLIAYPKGRPQRWFSRINDQDTGNSLYHFSESLTGRKSVWKSATRKNALFLSTAVQLNSDQLKPVFNWFKEKLKIGGSSVSFTASVCDDDKSTKKRVLSFLKAADLDIYDIQIDKQKFNPDLLSKEIPESSKERIIKELKDKEILDIRSIHKTASNELVSLGFDEESDGTKKVFSYAGPWLDVLKNGYILIIDELHNNLHPMLVKYLVELFHSDITNPHNAQLVFTTHETSILNQDVFRRDQVWFCEKDDSQSTSLYPLTDFSPKKDRDNLEAGYLSGRYGALPFIRAFTFDKAQ